MAAYGLYTHIASNKTKSMVLLAGLFLLVYVTVYAGGLVIEVLNVGDAPFDYYLKANANFQQLAGELSDLENKIAASRRFFNNAVSEYNTGIQQMPAALFAGMLGFTHKDFFDLGTSRTEVGAAPQVKF